jgi:hypothetical protein
LSGEGNAYGAVSPEDMAERREAYAREMMVEYPGARVDRIVRIEVAWPADGEDTGGYAVLLIDAQTHTAEELPIRRVYVRSNDGNETELRRVGAQRFTIPSESLAYTAFGPHQESGFYWAPMDLLTAQGELLVDFAANRTGFRASQLSMERPPGYNGGVHGSPNADALAVLLAREYAGFTPQ